MSQLGIFTQPTLEEATALRDTAIMSVTVNAGAEFGIRARDFIVNYLREHGDSPGEVIVVAAKNAGIVPHDSRAFGGPFQSLFRRKIIKKVGSCMRLFGHGTSGGIIWGLA